MRPLEFSAYVRALLLRTARPRSTATRAVAVLGALHTLPVYIDSRLPQSARRCSAADRAVVEYATYLLRAHSRSSSSIARDSAGGVALDRSLTSLHSARHRNDDNSGAATLNRTRSVVVRDRTRRIT